jgi:hypothetical protein
MLPHPETVRKISALRHQERLREVAQQRCADSPAGRGRSRLNASLAGHLMVVSWLTGLVTGGRGAKRVHVGSPLERASVRSVQQMT